MNTKFSGLPDPPALGDVFTKFPHGTAPLLALHDVVLREDSPLTIGERELIAAYVSGLNACKYCFNAHVGIAKAYDMDEAVFEKLLEDVDAAPVDDKLKPILKYAKKLTLEPAKVTPSDAEKVYGAGWSERALYDAILVVALFNFMNRVVEGTGCLPAGTKEYRPFTYMDWGKSVGFIPS
ncbi:MAG: peroxidase-related enzyme [Bacteroidota bacterium]